MIKWCLAATVICVVSMGLHGPGVAQTPRHPSSVAGRAPGLEGSPPTEASTAAAGDTTAADTVVVFPPKMKTTTGWERLVSLPGTILYVPFWLVFKATEATIALTEDAEVSSRLMRTITSPDGSHGIMPVYSSRSGFGLQFYQKNVPNDDARIKLAGAYGALGRGLAQARVRRIDLFGGALTFAGQITYRNLPDEKFYGIGPNSLQSDQTNYHLKSLIGELGLGKWLTPKLVVAGIAGADYYKPGPGESDSSPSTTTEYPPGTLPGLYDEIAVTRLMLGFYYAGQNRDVRPSAGWNIEGLSRISGQINGSGYEYVTSYLDVIKHTELWRDRILFLRFAFRLSDSLNGRQIPFYEGSELGASETIRGFQRGRFRDFDAILGTIEYRYPIWRTIDALFFVDAGQVQQDVFRDFEANETAVSYGGGFRFWKSDGIFLRAEIGFSEDGYKFLVLLNPSGERREFSSF